MTDDQQTEVQKMLDEISEDLSEWDNVTEWESDFMDSIREQWERRGTLTPKQIERLEDIYAKLFG